MCHDDALYKFTFYLLTYLLTIYREKNPLVNGLTGALWPRPGPQYFAEGAHASTIGPQ